jgi:hypothetical protein
MKLFPSERELARFHWRYFGRPLLIVVGVGALAGLAIGIVWVIAGLVYYYLLR